MNLIWKGSPNFSGNMGVKTHIVIHWFGMGDLESANATFQRASGDNRTSAHYGISDNTVYQWVHEANVAWHAFSANPYSIGIEHHARADYPATDATYKTSSQLVAEIAARHRIPLDKQHIIPHRQVVNTQCPGTLDLDRIIRRAIHIQGGVEEVTRIEAFQRVFIATAQRWPNEMETKAWESSGMEDYTWCQRFAKNPLIDEERIKAFQACFITVATRWPTAAETGAWIKSGWTAYEWVQKHAVNPIVEIKEEEIRRLNTLLEKTETASPDQELGQRFRELVGNATS